jgi:hypothetical protein
MFEDIDSWRANICSRTVQAYGRELNFKLTYIDIASEQYPLALKTAFEFISRNHSGRYRDRTLMAIRRWAENVENSTAVSRINESYDDNGRIFPIPMIAESPYSYDDDTESKNGGIVGINLGLDDGEGGFRGILCVSKNTRNNRIGSSLIHAMNSVSSGGLFDYYAGNKNFLAARTAASVGYAPVSINSETGVVHYRHTA